MAKKGSGAVASVASGLICLALGGTLGFHTRDSQMSQAADSAKSGSGKASGGSARAGGGPAAAGGAGAGAPNPGRDLTRLVSGLNTIEKVQNKGLTAEQKKQLAPIVEAIQKADSLPEAEATAKLEEMKKVLTPDQQQMLTDLTPQRGGRGGGGGGAPGGGSAPGGPGGGKGGAPGGMAGSGGPAVGLGGGGRAQADPNKPFASERNKKVLEDLIAQMK